jgi:hypothetical protein
MYDGQRVASANGEHGQVLATDSHYAHVQWDNGRVSMHELDELTAVSVSRDEVAASLADSLSVGGMEVTSARSVYDDSGPAGLLNFLAESGHLGSFTDIAEEALLLISQRVRTDPVLFNATAGLEDEEREDLVRLASVVLIRDAFGTET